jgi:hypothetical protein
MRQNYPTNQSACVTRKLAGCTGPGKRRPRGPRPKRQRHLSSFLPRLEEPWRSVLETQIFKGTMECSVIPRAWNSLIIHRARCSHVHKLICFVCVLFTQEWCLLEVTDVGRPVQAPNQHVVNVPFLLWTEHSWNCLIVQAVAAPKPQSRCLLMMARPPAHQSDRQDLELARHSFREAECYPACIKHRRANIEDQTRESGRDSPPRPR